jgi:hypothetical protein
MDFYGPISLALLRSLWLCRMLYPLLQQLKQGRGKLIAPIYRAAERMSSRKLVGFKGIQEDRSYCPLAFFHLSSSSPTKPDVTSL